MTLLLKKSILKAQCLKITQNRPNVARFWYFKTTMFEIFIFCPKTLLWFLEKIVDFFGWKTCENVVVLDFLAVGNFDFTRKIVKKSLGEKLVKMLWFWSF